VSTVGFVRSSLKQMHTTYNEGDKRSVTRTNVLASKLNPKSRFGHPPALGTHW